MGTKFLKNPVFWIIVGSLLVLGGGGQLRLVDNGLYLPDGVGILKTGKSGKTDKRQESNELYTHKFSVKDIEEPKTWGALQKQIGLTDTELRATFECTMGNGKAEQVDLGKLKNLSISGNDEKVMLVLKPGVCSDKP